MNAWLPMPTAVTLLRSAPVRKPQFLNAALPTEVMVFGTAVFGVMPETVPAFSNAEAPIVVTVPKSTLAPEALVWEPRLAQPLKVPSGIAVQVLVLPVGNATLVRPAQFSNRWKGTTTPAGSYSISAM